MLICENDFFALPLCIKTKLAVPTWYLSLQYSVFYMNVLLALTSVFVSFNARACVDFTVTIQVRVYKLALTLKTGSRYKIHFENDLPSKS